MWEYSTITISNYCHDHELVTSLGRGHPLSMYAKFSEKLTFLIPWRTCAYQGVKNVGFSENFVYALNVWSVMLHLRSHHIRHFPIFHLCLFSVLYSLKASAIVKYPLCLFSVLCLLKACAIVKYLLCFRNMFLITLIYLLTYFDIIEFLHNDWTPFSICI